MTKILDTLNGKKTYIVAAVAAVAAAASVLGEPGPGVGLAAD